MAPDPEDERNAAYVITWIPTLDSSVPPFTIRLDVRPPIASMSQVPAAGPPVRARQLRPSTA
jgi:hypothetical protein